MKKKKKKYLCKYCKDLGYIEVYGGSEADEWGVIARRPCEKPIHKVKK